MLFFEGGKKVLSIQESEKESCILMEIDGELRSETAYDILDELVAMATVGANVLVDMKKVTYITSSTMQVFLTVQQEMDTLGKGSLTLQGLPEAIFTEFNRVGLTELLMIED